MLPVTSLICFAGAVALVSASGFITPNSACESMSPRSPAHGGALPQTTPAPVTFVLDHTSITNSDKVEFTIRSDNEKGFLGFMVQARDDASATPNKPVGSFQPKGDNAATISCSGENDTGSHNNPDAKKSVTLIWTPPSDFRGKATFYATVLEDLPIYWVKEKAGTVDVN